MTLPVPHKTNPNKDQLLLSMAETMVEMLKGRDNSTSTFTLTANATTTTVTDNLFNSDQMPAWTPTTANAAGAMTNLYVSARTNGSFTLTHANTATTDRVFLYTRRG